MADWEWTEEELIDMFEKAYKRIEANAPFRANFVDLSEDGKTLIITPQEGKLVCVPLHLLGLEELTFYVLSLDGEFLYLSPDDDSDPLNIYNILKGYYGSMLWMEQYPEKIKDYTTLKYLTDTLPNLNTGEWESKHIQRMLALIGDYTEECKQALGS